MEKWIGYQKGINLGGWFSQCDYTEEHFQNFITEDDFDCFSKWNIDHVRIPVDYNLVETEDGAYKSSGFLHIQRAVDWCEKYGLNMILDLHKTAGYSFDEGSNRFFDDEMLQERFFRLWEEFTKRYAKYHRRIAFELLNEITLPEFSEAWNNIARKAIQRIRAVSSDVTILVGSYYNNHISALFALDEPYDKNIVYNFHCYEPVLFTHQKAYWLPDTKKIPKDMQIFYPDTTAHYAEIANKYKMSPMFNYDSLQVKNFSPAYFEEIFADGIQIAEKRGVRLYCGEFGVIDQADLQSTLNWYRDIHAVFKYYEIGHAVWTYRGKDFGISDDRMNDIRDEIISLL